MKRLFFLASGLLALLGSGAGCTATRLVNTPQAGRPLPVPPLSKAGTALVPLPAPTDVAPYGDTVFYQKGRQFARKYRPAGIGFAAFGLGLLTGPFGPLILATAPPRLPATVPVAVAPNGVPRTERQPIASDLRASPDFVAGYSSKPRNSGGRQPSRRGCWGRW